MSMRQREFDAWVKARMGKEDCPVPEGFDQRLEQRLRALPERGGGGRKLGRQIVILAAAVCLLTVCAGATVLTLKQGTAHLFDTEEELLHVRHAGGAGGTQGNCG